MLNKKNLFLFLIPVFFVLHGYNSNFGFIDFKDVLLLILLYGIGALLLYGISYLVFRNRVTASLFAAYLLSFFLFYGALRDFLKVHFLFASRYRFLLPVFLVLLVFLLIYFKKTNRNFSKLVLFLNLLLCIYLVVDITGIIAKKVHPPSNLFSVYPFVSKAANSQAINVKKPDIYFLVFDEYAGSQSLKDNYGFSNPLDTFLVSKGFTIQKNAISNYHYTWVSLASILNMSYINGLPYNKQLEPDDIGSCLQLIKNNEVVKFLSQQEYSVANFSTFDLAGNPSLVDETYLPVKTKLITENTLWARANRDMGWMTQYAEWLDFRSVFDQLSIDQQLLNKTKDFSAVKRSRPVFVYGHYHLSHNPFYFNKEGVAKKKDQLLSEGAEKYQNINAYLENLQYSNSRIKGLIDTIQANTNGKAVIILMGDHGFRQKISLNMRRNFQPMNAVYLPEKNYQLFYDSISGVNQFRVIFNTLFQQSIPLLSDSTVFLRLRTSVKSN